MRRINTICLFLLLICPISFSQAAQQESNKPYASKPDVPKELVKSYIAISINKAQAPDSARVGVPGYPGAMLINSFAGIKKADGEYKRLPYIELISVDDVDTVLTFFDDRLTGWKIGGFNTAVYYAEKGKVNIFKPESTHVGIHDALKYYRENDQKDLQKIIPGAKSLIKIFYD